MSAQTDPRELSGSYSRNHKPQSVAVFHPQLRYTVPEAAGLLKRSVSKIWDLINKGDVQVIREGGRVFVPGSEIVRRSSLPHQPAA